MSSQPQGEQLMLHGGKQAPPPKRGAKHPYASSWSPDERQFADNVILAWNNAFQGHPRANKVRRNRTAAIQLYRWIHGPENDATPKMTEEDVFKAIVAYSRDPRYASPDDFASFGNWFRACPDNVDKQLSRIGEERGAGLPQKDGPGNKTGQFAARLLGIAGLGRLAKLATEADEPLTSRVRVWSKRRIPPPPKTGGRDTHATERAWRAKILRLFAAFMDLSLQERSTFIRRGRFYAAAYLGRELDDSLGTQNLVIALAVGYLQHQRHATIDQPVEEGES